MIRGFVLGKFMPPHSGHIGMCRAAREQCDVLSVLVCTRDVEPVPGHLRASWMRQLLPNANIIHLHRDIPQAPEEHPEFWSIWIEAIRELHPEPIDRVFGSEEYVLRLANELGAEPVLIDPDRLAFPISGTAVRLDPYSNWNHVPHAVRPWYQKRVIVFGPESVGKSTLAKFLAQYLNSPYVPEYGRTYDRYKLTSEWTAADFTRIAQGHSALRAAVSPCAGPILIEDTDPLLTSVWARMLTGEAHNLESTTELGDLYLLLKTDVPWVNDGTRYFEREQRDRFYGLCREVLRRRTANFVEIGGSWSAREKMAILELDRLQAFQKRA
jgi:NadR type nicotinamide-nucleotide adenylyltransferase